MNKGINPIKNDTAVCFGYFPGCRCHSLDHFSKLVSSIYFCLAQCLPLLYHCTYRRLTCGQEELFCLLTPNARARQVCKGKRVVKTREYLSTVYLSTRHTHAHTLRLRVSLSGGWIGPLPARLRLRVLFKQSKDQGEEDNSYQLMTHSQKFDLTLKLTRTPQILFQRRKHSDSGTK